MLFHFRVNYVDQIRRGKSHIKMIALVVTYDLRSDKTSRTIIVHSIATENSVWFNVQCLIDNSGNICKHLRSIIYIMNWRTFLFYFFA